MPTELTLEAAIIELNRLKTTERMYINRERLIAAIDTLKDAARFRIKRKPVAEGTDDMDFYLCPNCKVSVGSLDDTFEMNQESKYCYHCGQALDWSTAGCYEPLDWRRL